MNKSPEGYNKTPLVGDNYRRQRYLNPKPDFNRLDEENFACIYKRVSTCDATYIHTLLYYSGYQSDSHELYPSWFVSEHNRILDDWQLHLDKDPQQLQLARDGQAEVLANYLDVDQSEAIAKQIRADRFNGQPQVVVADSLENPEIMTAHLDCDSQAIVLPSGLVLAMAQLGINPGSEEFWSHPNFADITVKSNFAWSIVGSYDGPRQPLTIDPTASYLVRHGLYHGGGRLDDEGQPRVGSINEVSYRLNNALAANLAEELADHQISPAQLADARLLKALDCLVPNFQKDLAKIALGCPGSTPDYKLDRELEAQLSQVDRLLEDNVYLSSQRRFNLRPVARQDIFKYSHNLKQAFLPEHRSKVDQALADISH